MFHGLQDIAEGRVADVVKLLVLLTWEEQRACGHLIGQILVVVIAMSVGRHDVLLS